MTRDGIKQDITVLPANSQQAMVIQIGSGDDASLTQLAIDTPIQYYNEDTQTWIEGTVWSYNSIKVSEEIIKLDANTQIQLLSNTSQTGLLIFSTAMYNIEYDAEDLITAYQFLYGSGIVMDKLFGEIYHGGGRQVIIESAMFIIDGYVGFFKVPQSVILDIGDTQPRKDLLILRKVPADNDVYLTVKKGTPAVSPSAPTLTRNADGIFEIALAEITVQANATVISSGDIKDVRHSIFRYSSFIYPNVSEIEIYSQLTLKGNYAVQSAYNVAGEIDGFGQTGLLNLKKSVLEIEKNQKTLYLEEDDIEILEWNFVNDTENYINVTNSLATIVTGGQSTTESPPNFVKHSACPYTLINREVDKDYYVMIEAGDRFYDINLYNIKTDDTALYLPNVAIGVNYKIAGHGDILTCQADLEYDCLTILRSKANYQASAGLFGKASATMGIAKALTYPSVRRFYQPYMIFRIKFFMIGDDGSIEIPQSCYVDANWRNRIAIKYRVK